ncbi:MAG TPA: cysteine--tRNA ligase [Candidatus Babeliales bacterium]|nr:cysteine--tRNA ligase [Candidatus Babeliales bacterium]
MNTLTGRKEELIKGKTVKMYVCGVTPYDNAHVGHGRCYVSFDLLKRFLSFSGLDVTYCRNFTDIDDKTMNRAEKEFGDRLRYHEIADRYINNFHEDITKLNCLSPECEPRVTENIPQIIEFIQELIAKGCAYQAGNDVYFRIETFPGYGKLSKQKIEDLHAGARVDVREQKENPLDFALWKGEPEGEFWPSPWGYGRPGWHIECSVLARINLGEHIDIHGGGLDLIFPHHENEIAQSESLFGAPFSRLWMHNGMININKEKMSKSLGNFFFLRDLYKHFDPMVIRYFFLTHHYRMPVEFSFDALATAQKSYERLIRLCDVDCSDIDVSAYHSDVIDRMVGFLQDDLNTPGLLGVVFEHIADIAHNKNELAAVKNILMNVFGLTLQPLSAQKVELTPEIQALIDARNKARREKDWARSDELRDQLKELGVDVHDEKL